MHHHIAVQDIFLIVPKEVQNAFWQGPGGVPQSKFPHDWGIKGVDKD
jgi:hypothetical protein